MTTRTHLHLRLRFLHLLPLVLAVSVLAQGQAGISDAVSQQIAAIETAKQNFTPAQQKMDSHLVFAAMQERHAPEVQAFAAALTPPARTPSGKVLVDIKAMVSDALLAEIKNLGGEVIYPSSRWGTIRAAVPLQGIETLASRAEVTRVSSRVWAHTNIGSVTSQGYVAHRAKDVVENLGIDGAGVTVGVLSDSASAARIAALKATGDLPSTAHALPGQNGSGTDEGAAMMEIVYDMAPGSNQLFATAFTSEASFADNIIALQAAGCKVIVDDVTYFDEPVFQDGIIAQAVNQVTAAGSIYFSSAANSGSAFFHTSGTWEGDFKDGGPVSGVIGTHEGGKGHFHDFGGQIFEPFIAPPSGVVFLHWSDEQGDSSNDYDLFVTDSSGTVLKAFSSDRQTGPGSDPIEGLQYSGVTGDRVYVVLYSGSPRALHLDTERSEIQIATDGATFGHNAGLNTVSMAATYWGSAHKGLVPFTGFANPVETFSSDGPRKIFYNPDGSAITPGNFLFKTHGGRTLQKPDLTAADGVFTKTPGFLPFFGTSAAAPHAAGIAALVLSARPSFTPAEVKKAMTATALDTMSRGVDPNSGFGITMATGAVKYALRH